MRTAKTLLILTLAVACTEKKKTAPSEPSGDGVSYESLGEGALSELGAEIYTELLSSTASPSTEEESLFAFRPGEGPKSKGPLAARLYQQRAEATVAIRLPNGHGTGFLLSPAREGWLVTNYHVAAEGARDEGGRTVVSVEFGQLEDGVMERHPRVGRAVVYDWDPNQDLALLRLEAPPPVDVGLEVADAVPTPGSSVVLFGQGGVGLMWQVRECEISAIGTIGDDISVLPTDCHQFAKVEPDAASRCREMVERTRRHRIADVRYVQSTCQFAGGDSGGPLLNSDGAVVGVSSFYRTSPDPKRPSEAGYFHIHRDELRAFLEKASRNEPLAERTPGTGGLRFGKLPDDVRLRGRSNRTGAARVALVEHEQLRGILVDFGQGGLPPSGPFAAARKGLSPDFALSVTADGLFAEYDRDGDGSFDIVLVAGEAPLPVTIDGSRPAGEPVIQYVGQKIVRGDVFEPGRSRALLAALSDSVPPTLLGKAELAPQSQFPDWYRDTGPRLAVDNVSGALVFYSTGQPAEAWVIDLDNDSLGSRATREAARSVYEQQAVDWELAIVHSGPFIWTFYDFDSSPGPEHIGFSMGRDQVVFAPRGEALEASRARGQQAPCDLSLVPERLRSRVRQISQSLFRVQLCQ